MDTKIAPRPEVRVPKIIILYELVIGSFELISSLGIFLLGSKLFGLYNNLKSSELIQDPNDLTVRLTERLIPHLFNHRLDIALLLLAFGLIKITSGVGLIYKKLWAEYLLVIFLIVLIPFEVLSFVRNFSLPDLAYLVIDVVIVLYLMDFQPKEYLHRLIKDLRPEATKRDHS